MSIPKIVHQIWIGPLPAPEAWMRTWREKHPPENGWTYRVWTNHDLINEGWINADKIAEMREWNGKADIMRWEILLRYGGIVVDADSECVEPFNDTFLAHENFACFENELCRPGLIAAGYVGAEVGSPLMRRLVTEIARRHLEGRAWECVGPKLLTEFTDNTLYVYPARVFIPLHFTGVEAPGREVVHARQHWGSTLGYPAQKPGLAKTRAPSRAGAPGTQIDVGIPAYRDISVRTVQTVLALIAFASQRGVSVQFGCVNGIAVVDLARAEVVGKFLHDSPGQHLLMLDTDVAIEPVHVLQMLDADRDIVSAPMRTKKQVWAFRPHEGDMSTTPIYVHNSMRFIEVSASSCACMLVKRHVLEKLHEAHPELYYGAPPTEGERPEYCAMFRTYLDTVFGRKAFIGEDFAFCERAKALGFRIEVAIDMIAEHAGEAMWLGRELDKARAAAGLPAVTLDSSMETRGAA